MAGLAEPVTETLSQIEFQIAKLDSDLTAMERKIEAAIMAQMPEAELEDLYLQAQIIRIDLETEKGKLPSDYGKTQQPAAKPAAIVGLKLASGPGASVTSASGAAENHGAFTISSGAGISESSGPVQPKATQQVPEFAHPTPGTAQQKYVRMFAELGDSESDPEDDDDDD